LEIAWGVLLSGVRRREEYSAWRKWRERKEFTTEETEGRGDDGEMRKFWCGDNHASIPPLRAGRRRRCPVGMTAFGGGAGSGPFGAQDRRDGSKIRWR
jgi:hypothetical protein